MLLAPLSLEELSPRECLACKCLYQSYLLPQQNTSQGFIKQCLVIYNTHQKSLKMPHKMRTHQQLKSHCFRVISHQFSAINTFIHLSVMFHLSNHVFYIMMNFNFHYHNDVYTSCKHLFSLEENLSPIHQHCSLSIYEIH